MSDRLAIFTVIPAYNESATIATVVTDVKRYANAVIVVDDGSSDDTAALARAAGATVVRHPVNRDQGASLQTGDELALALGAGVIVHFDADGQHRAAEIPDVAGPVLRNEADVVFGSRFLGRDSNMPALKRLILFPIARLVNLLVLGVKLTDPQSGFRALSTRVVASIEIEQDGKAHCSEILGKVIRGGWRVKEVPVTVVYHEFGLSFSHGWRILKDLMIGKLIN